MRHLLWPVWRSAMAAQAWRTQTLASVSSRTITSHNLPKAAQVKSGIGAGPGHTSGRAQPVLSSIIEIRDYQKDCIEQCLEALARGVTRMAASLPTGSGKTTIFVNLLHSLPPRQLASGKVARNTLIIVNGIELARQAAIQLKRLFPSTTVELEQGNNNASGTADVSIATIQTLIRGGRVHKFDRDSLKCIIVDEAHHAVAKSYRDVLAIFNSGVRTEPGSGETSEPEPEPPNVSGDGLPALAPVSHGTISCAEPATNQVPIIGFSATFARHDRLALGSVFEEIVYHHELVDMITSKWLCPVKFVSIDVDLDLRNVTINGGRLGDFSPSRLSDVVDTPEINNLIVASWRDRAADRKSTLVFACDIEHTRNLMLEFRRHGYDARMIYGDTPARDRCILLDDFRASKFPVLVNCAVLTEGADVPNIDCVFLARPTRSRGFLTQMIGRGLRQSPGKEDCLVMDILGSVQRGVVVRPSLEGLNPSDLLEAPDAEDPDVEEAEEAKGPRTVNGAVSVDGITYTDYDSPFDIEEDLSGVRNLHQITSHAWVGCGDDVFVLDLMGYGHFTVQPVLPGEWQASLTRKVRRSAGGEHQNRGLVRFATPTKIAECSTLAEAMGAADNFARSSLKRIPGMPPHLLIGLSRHAKWRKTPATEVQKAVLKKRLGLAKGGSNEATNALTIGERQWAISLQDITKGQAANLLTRLSHGAKKRLEAQEKRAKKAINTRRLAEQRDIGVGKLSS